MFAAGSSLTVAIALCCAVKLLEWHVFLIERVINGVGHIGLLVPREGGGQPFFYCTLAQELVRNRPGQATPVYD